MIRKLRFKFVLYATCSVAVLLLLILGSINIANFTQTGNDADAVTNQLVLGQGSFPFDPFSPIPPNNETPTGTPAEDPGPHGPGSLENDASIRYFTVAFDEIGNGRMVKKAMRDDTVTDLQAIEWARGLTQGKGWTKTYYRYRAYLVGAETYVSVIDFSRELAPSYRVLWSSIIGSSIGIVATMLLLIPVSKILVRPLEASRKKQQRFISDASHELKTPITIISANNEIIEMEQGASESTKTIAKQVNRLSMMVKNLNSLARIDELEKTEFASFDLAELCTDVITSFNDSITAKGLKFESEIPATLAFKGDYSLMQKMLTIFLDNALKYATDHVRFALYTKGESQKEKRIVIKVRNDAEGIPDGPLDRVFERFYRSDWARGSEIEGSGIGLSIAQEIVSKHSGRIFAKGENGDFVIKAEF